MHSPLDKYLEKVAAQLKPLPTARRDEELREMRQHLLIAMSVNQEAGQSEDEAAANAVAQFGTPNVVGERVVLAWRRGEGMQKRDFWSIAVFTLSLSQLVPRLFGLLVLPPVNHLLQSHPLPSSTWSCLMWLAILGGDTCLYVLAGAIGGIVFPRQAIKGAVAGATLGIVFHSCLILIQFACIAALHTHGAVISSPQGVTVTTSGLAGTAAQVATFLFAVPAAWAGGRWREKRAWLVRGI